MTVESDRPEWHRWAACRGQDPDLFFPVRGDDIEAARSFCLSCPVKAVCQEHGLRHEHHGIWGGLSERQRRDRRRRFGIRIHEPDLTETEAS